MMSKFCQKAAATFLVFLLAFCLIPPQVTQAATPEELYELQIQNALLQAQISELQQQIDALKNMPTPTPLPIPVYAPLIRLLSPQTFSIQSDETANITLDLKNIGTSSAMNLLLQVSADAGSPFTVEFEKQANNVGTITENGVKSVPLRIVTDKNAKAGTYTVTLRYAYKNRDNDNLSGTDTFTVRIESTAKTPRISLSNIKADNPSLAPGESFTVTASLQNTGDGTATNAQVSLEGLAADKVYLTSDINNAFVKTLPPEHNSLLSFTFAVSPNAASGTYPITFNLTAKDEAGENLTNSYIYYINVTAAEEADRAQLATAELSVPSGTVNPGRSATVQVPLINKGSVTAKNIRITAKPSDESAVVPLSASIQTVASLAPNGETTLTFTFSPTDASQTRNYMIELLIEYETGRLTKDGLPEVDSFHQYAGINVHNPEKEADPTPTPGERFPKPKMIVSEYACDPGIVRAGREFDLMLTFQNASALRSVNNLKITLTALETTEKKGSVFTPVNGSNTFYIDYIDPKGEVEQTLRMYTVPDAEPRTYNIMVSFRYQDEDYNEYEEQEQISINVKQVTRIETSEFFLPTEAPLYQPIYIYFSVINSGRVSLSNLRVRVDGNFDSASADMYIGNLGRGNSIYYEGSFTPTEVGQLEGAIVVYGEDDTGEIVELSKPFTLNAFEMVYEQPADGGFPMPGMETPPGGEAASFWQQSLDFVKKPYVWIPAAVVVIVVIIVVARVVRNKKRIDFDE